MTLTPDDPISIESNARWLEATYRVSASPQRIESRAEALALEQSVELPFEAINDARVERDVVAQVAGIVPLEVDTFEVTLRLAVETTGDEPGQLLNMLFGNSSLHGDVVLTDARLPAGLVDAFPGPRFGVGGIRELTGAYGRPLTCTALKPQGLMPVQLAALAGTFARGGVDVIKDDHGLADQASAPFASRVEAIQRTVDTVNLENGTRCVYAPSLTGNLDQIRAQVELSQRCGVRMMMLAPMISGVATLALLARESGMPLMAHPALAGVGRMAPALLIGKLFRLFGADATIFPNAGGRFAFAPAECERLADLARRPWNKLKPALPVPAGGMSVDRVNEMHARYGNDTMFLIGGSLLSAREALLDRTREFVGAVRSLGARQ